MNRQIKIEIINCIGEEIDFADKKVVIADRETNEVISNFYGRNFWIEKFTIQQFNHIEHMINTILNDIKRMTNENRI